MALIYIYQILGRMPHRGAPRGARGANYGVWEEEDELKIKMMTYQNEIDRNNGC